METDSRALVGATESLRAREEDLATNHPASHGRAAAAEIIYARGTEMTAFFAALSDEESVRCGASRALAILDDYELSLRRKQVGHHQHKLDPHVVHNFVNDAIRAVSRPGASAVSMLPVVWRLYEFSQNLHHDQHATAAVVAALVTLLQVTGRTIVCSLCEPHQESARANKTLAPVLALSGAEQNSFLNAVGGMLHALNTPSSFPVFARLAYEPWPMVDQLSRSDIIGGGNLYVALSLLFQLKGKATKKGNPETIRYAASFNVHESISNFFEMYNNVYNFMGQELSGPECLDSLLTAAIDCTRAANERELAAWNRHRPVGGGGGAWFPSWRGGARNEPPPAHILNDAQLAVRSLERVRKLVATPSVVAILPRLDRLPSNKRTMLAHLIASQAMLEPEAGGVFVSFLAGKDAVSFANDILLAFASIALQPSVGQVRVGVAARASALKTFQGCLRRDVRYLWSEHLRTACERSLNTALGSALGELPGADFAQLDLYTHVHDLQLFEAPCGDPTCASQRSAGLAVSAWLAAKVTSIKDIGPANAMRGGWSLSEHHVINIADELAAILDGRCSLEPPLTVIDNGQVRTASALERTSAFVAPIVDMFGAAFRAAASVHVFSRRFAFFDLFLPIFRCILVAPRFVSIAESADWFDADHAVEAIASAARGDALSSIGEMQRESDQRCNAEFLDSIARAEARAGPLPGVYVAAARAFGEILAWTPKHAEGVLTASQSRGAIARLAQSNFLRVFTMLESSDFLAPAPGRLNALTLSFATAALTAANEFIVQPHDRPMNRFCMPREWSIVCRMRDFDASRPLLWATSLRVKYNEALENLRASLHASKEALLCGNLWRAEVDALLPIADDPSFRGSTAKTVFSEFCSVINEPYFSHAGNTFYEASIVQFKREFAVLDEQLARLREVCKFLSSRGLAFPIEPSLCDKLTDLRAEFDSKRDLLGLDRETLEVLMHFVGRSDLFVSYFDAHRLTTQEATTLRSARAAVQRLVKLICNDNVELGELRGVVGEGGNDHSEIEVLAEYVRSHPQLQDAAGTGDFSQKLAVLQSARKLLRIQSSAHSALTAMRELVLIPQAELDGMLSKAEIQQLADPQGILRLKMREAVDVLGSVERVLGGLSQSTLEVLAQLGRAPAVYQWLVREDPDDAASWEARHEQALSLASANPFPHMVLQRLGHLRHLFFPLYRNARVRSSSKALSDFFVAPLMRREEGALFAYSRDHPRDDMEGATADEQGAATLLDDLRLLDKEFFSVDLFFDGDKEHSVNKIHVLVPVFLHSGAFYSTIAAADGGAALTFRFRTSAVEAGRKEKEENLPSDILLKYVQAARFVQAPSLEQARALRAFVEAFDQAHACHEVRLELEEAGHPQHQAVKPFHLWPFNDRPSGSDGILADTAMDPEALRRLSEDWGRDLQNWRDQLSNAQKQDPRLLLLSNRGLLRFVKASENPFMDALDLLPFVTQCLGPSAEASVDNRDNLCADIAAAIPEVFKMRTQNALDRCIELLRRVMEKPAFDEDARGRVTRVDLRGMPPHLAYAHMLRHSMQNGGVSPGQLLWASPATTRRDIEELLQVVETPGLVEDVYIFEANRLSTVMSETLLQGILNRPRIGCNVRIFFTGDDRIDNFLAYDLDKEIQASVELPTDVELRNWGLSALDSAVPPNTLFKPVVSVKFFAGEAGIGKSTHIQRHILELSPSRNSVARLVVHEGFVVAQAIERVRALFVEAKKAPAENRRAVLHIDISGVGADVRALAYFMHNLLARGLIIDPATGTTVCLESDVRMHVFIELPALELLEDSEPRGPCRWPVSGTAPASKHPYIPLLGPVLFADRDRGNRVFRTTEPWILDSAARSVAEFDAWRRKAGRDVSSSTYVPSVPLAASTTVLDADAAALRASLSATMAEFGLSDEIPAVQSDFISLYSARLQYLCKIQASVVGMAREDMNPLRMTVDPTASTFSTSFVNKQNVTVTISARDYFIKDFFAAMGSLMARESARLVRCSSTSISSREVSAWPICPEDLMNFSVLLTKPDSAPLSADEKKRAAGGFQHSAALSLSADASGDEWRSVIHNLGPLFGKAGGSLAPSLASADFVLTPPSLVKLLSLHARCSTRRNVLFSGDTGVGKSFLLELYSHIVNSGSAVSFDAVYHLKMLLKTCAQARAHVKDCYAGLLDRPSTAPPDFDPRTNKWKINGVDVAVRTREIDGFGTAETLQCALAILAVDGAFVVSVIALHFSRMFKRHPLQDGLTGPLRAQLQSCAVAGGLGDKSTSDQVLNVIRVVESIIPGLKSLPEPLAHEAPTNAQPADSAAAEARAALGDKKGLAVFVSALIAPMKSTLIYRRILCHEAIGPREWKVFMDTLRADAKRHKDLTLCVFVDEINTASALGMVSEAIVSRSVNGEPLPSNIFFVGALNPATPAPAPEEAPPAAPTRAQGPVESDLQAAVLDERAVELAEVSSIRAPPPFVVRVLPPAAGIFVAEFGEVDPLAERSFLRAFLEKMEDKSDAVSRAGWSVEQVSSMILAAQGAVRDFKIDRVHVSIRDMLRVVKLFYWLSDPERWVPSGATLGQTGAPRANIFLPEGLNAGSREASRQALAVAIALTYFLRLPGAAHTRENARLRNFRARFMQVTQTALHSLEIDRVLRNSVDHLWTYLEIPSIYAKTFALSENVFSIVIAVNVGIPILITGPPGCGKTLSFMLAEMNSKGNNSPSVPFRSLKKVTQFPYQCSELSTSAEILGVYASAKERYASMQRSASGSNKNVCVVFLDEAGLPKEKKQALKSLHDVLDKPEGVPSVLLSNTTLDAAKNNRTLQVLQSQADEQDLRVLAIGLIFDAEHAAALRNPDINFTVPEAVVRQQAQLVDGLCSAYLGLNTLVRALGTTEWFHQRDYIYLLRYLRRSMKESGSVSIGGADLLAGLRRNFQTAQPTAFPRIAQSFITACRVDLPTPLMPAQPLQSLKDALDDRCTDPSAAPFRHTLVVDRTNSQAAIALLFSLKLLDRAQSEIVCLSDFSDDVESASTLHTEALIKVQTAAEEGKTLLLVNCAPIYSALFDVFNRNYSVVRGEHWARISLGSVSRDTKVHPNFRVVVHMTERDLAHTATPFLNRFSKFVLSAKDAFEMRTELVALNPPACLRELAPKYVRLVFDALREGVEDFVRFLGATVFYGLVSDETVPALLLRLLEDAEAGATLFRVRTALHADDAASVGVALDALIAEQGLHKSGSLGGGDDAAANPPTGETALEPAAPLAPSSVVISRDDSLDPQTGIIGRTKYLIRALNFQLLQQARPEAVFAAKARLPARYIREYVQKQEHFSAANQVRSLIASRAAASAAGPNAQFGEPASRKVIIMTRTCTEIASLARNGAEAARTLRVDVILFSATQAFTSSSTGRALGGTRRATTATRYFAYCGQVEGTENDVGVSSSGGGSAILSEGGGATAAVDSASVDPRGHKRPCVALVALSACRTTAVCEGTIDRFFALAARHGTASAPGMTPAPSTLIVCADMSIVTQSQVNVARFAADRGLAALVANGTHHTALPLVIFLIHSPAELLAIASAYQPLALGGWDVSFTDAFGADGGMGSKTGSRTLMSPRVVVALAYGLKTPLDVDSVRSVFKEHADARLEDALRRLTYPQARMTDAQMALAGVTKSLSAYSKDAKEPRGFAWVQSLLHKSPYVTDALMVSFRALYEQLLERIFNSACQKLSRGEAVRGLLAVTRDGQRWAFSDYMKVASRTLVNQWALESLALLPSSGFDPAQAVGNNPHALAALTVDVIAAARPLKPENLLDIETADDLSASNAVICKAPFAPRTPLFFALHDTLRDFFSSNGQRAETATRALNAAAAVVQRAPGSPPPSVEDVRVIALTRIVRRIEGEPALFNAWLRDVVLNTFSVAKPADAARPDDVSKLLPHEIDLTMIVAQSAASDAAESAAAESERSMFAVLANELAVKTKVKIVLTKLMSLRGLLSGAEIQAIADREGGVGADATWNAFTRAALAVLETRLAAFSRAQPSDDDVREWVAHVRPLVSPGGKLATVADAREAGLLQSADSVRASVAVSSAFMALSCGAPVAVFQRVSEIARTAARAAAGTAAALPPQATFTIDDAAPTLQACELALSVLRDLSRAGTWTPAAHSEMAVVFSKWVLSVDRPNRNDGLDVGAEWRDVPDAALRSIVLGLVGADQTTDQVAVILRNAPERVRVALLGSLLVSSGAAPTAPEGTLLAALRRATPAAAGGRAVVLTDAARATSTKWLRAAIPGLAPAPANVPRNALLLASAFSRAIAARTPSAGVSYADAVARAAAAVQSSITTSQADATCFVAAARVAASTEALIDALFTAIVNVPAPEWPTLVGATSMKTIKAALALAPFEYGALLAARISVNNGALHSFLGSPLIVALGMTAWQPASDDGRNLLLLALERVRAGVEIASSALGPPPRALLHHATAASPTSGLQLLHKLTEEHLKYNKHIPLMIEMYNFAYTHMAYRFTAAELDVMDLEVALATLPPATRREGEQLLQRFLLGWRDLRYAFETYEVCPREMAANAFIEPLALASGFPLRTVDGGRDEPNGLSPVTIKVAQVVTVPGEEGDQDRCCPLRMLRQRLLKSQIVSSPEVSRLRDDSNSFNRFGVQLGALKTVPVEIVPHLGTEALTLGLRESALLREMDARATFRVDVLPVDPDPVPTVSPAEIHAQRVREQNKLAELQQNSMVGKLCTSGNQKYFVTPCCNKICGYFKGCNLFKCGRDYHDLPSDPVQPGGYCGTFTTKSRSDHALKNAPPVHPDLMAFCLRHEDVMSRTYGIVTPAPGVDFRYFAELPPAPAGPPPPPPPPLPRGHWELPNADAVIRLAVAEALAGRVEIDFGDLAKALPLRVAMAPQPSPSHGSGSGASALSPPAAPSIVEDDGDSLHRLERSAGLLASALNGIRIPAGIPLSKADDLAVSTTVKSLSDEDARMALVEDLITLAATARRRAADAAGRNDAVAKLSNETFQDMQRALPPRTWSPTISRYWGTRRTADLPSIACAVAKAVPDAAFASEVLLDKPFAPGVEGELQRQKCGLLALPRDLKVAAVTDFRSFSDFLRPSDQLQHLRFDAAKPLSKLFGAQAAARGAAAAVLATAVQKQNFGPLMRWLRRLIGELEASVAAIGDNDGSGADAGPAIYVEKIVEDALRHYADAVPEAEERKVPLVGPAAAAAAVRDASAAVHDESDMPPSIAIAAPTGDVPSAIGATSAAATLGGSFSGALGGAAALPVTPKVLRVTDIVTAFIASLPASERATAGLDDALKAQLAAAVKSGMVKAMLDGTRVLRDSFDRWVRETGGLVVPAAAVAPATQARLLTAYAANIGLSHDDALYLVQRGVLNIDAGGHLIGGDAAADDALREHVPPLMQDDVFANIQANASLDTEEEILKSLGMFDGPPLRIINVGGVNCVLLQDLVRWLS